MVEMIISVGVVLAKGLAIAVIMAMCGAIYLVETKRMAQDA